ncbi:hypothetical protein ZEAMMB73_Zm00001d008680 [Zea mays]|uniref:Uncharacterized protein n=1 Tax=Zea mays TaxID=4577 RepID=A0A1D6FEQ3_MAIZE|nr:hypothetical protein ZEAMMB73_Zm00001d008680 [Zea mays]
METTRVAPQALLSGLQRVSWPERRKGTVAPLRPARHQVHVQQVFNTYLGEARAALAAAAQDTDDVDAAAATLGLVTAALEMSPRAEAALELRARAPHAQTLPRQIRAAAENVLPGWGRGGERLSLLLRLRRRLLLSVTSQCGGRRAASTEPGTPPRGSRVVRLLRSAWARLPRATSIWRRKKQAPARVVPRDRRGQSPTPARPGFWAVAWTPTSAATLRFVAVVVAIAAVLAVALAIDAAFRVTDDLGNRRGGWDSKPIARWATFLELMEHPPLPWNYNYKWLPGAPKRGLEWIFSK